MPLGQLLSGRSRVASGQRTRQVVIQQRPAPDGQGGSGFPVDTWTTLATEWMSRKDGIAGETFSAGQTSATTETSWHMEYRADMDPELVDVPKLRRLLWEGRLYDVMAAARIGEKYGIELVTIQSQVTT